MNSDTRTHKIEFKNKFKPEISILKRILKFQITLIFSNGNYEIIQMKSNS